MAFVRWDPLRELLAIQQQLDRVRPGPPGWVPPVDLHETDDRYVLTAEVPGLAREDIHIEVEEDRLSLSGSRRERATACEQFHRVERGHGEFRRTFQLGHAVDASRITADLKDGVLTVDIPKSADVPLRRVRVSG